VYEKVGPHPVPVARSRILDYPRSMHAVPLLALLAAGCVEYDAPKKVDEHAGASPVIEVTPSSLDFGALDSGASAVGTFTVRSAGDVALEVSAIRIASTAFTLVTDPLAAGPLRLAPDESVDVDVVFSPVNPTDSSWVSIYSDDVATPEARVTLKGAGAVPAIAIDPAEVDFGAVEGGLTEELDVDIVNTGSATLNVGSVSITGTGFTGWLVEDNAPFALAPGERAPVRVAFTPSGAGEYDGTLWVGSDAPSGIASAPLHGVSGLPIAVCSVTPDTVAANAEEATLDGSASYDPEGGALVAWTWTLLSRPAGSGAVLPGFDTAMVEGFQADLAGVYEFALVVENEAGLLSEPCITTLEAVPAQDLWIELYWEHDGDDLDLHLLAPGGTLTTAEDCYFANCVGGGLDWGIPSDAMDNPRLDIDDIPGTGPENINIASPVDGVYTVYVHDYPGSVYNSDNAATVRVYLGGALAFTDTVTIGGENDYVPVAEIVWPDAYVIAP
jgi:hypothetical protein